MCAFQECSCSCAEGGNWKQSWASTPPRRSEPVWRDARCSGDGFAFRRYQPLQYIEDKPFWQSSKYVKRRQHVAKLFKTWKCYDMLWRDVTSMVSTEWEILSFTTPLSHHEEDEEVLWAAIQEAAGAGAVPLFTHGYHLDNIWIKDDNLEGFNKVPTYFQMVLAFINCSRARLSNRNVFWGQYQLEILAECERPFGTSRRALTRKTGTAFFSKLSKQHNPVPGTQLLGGINGFKVQDVTTCLVCSNKQHFFLKYFLFVFQITKLFSEIPFWL